MLAPPAPPFSLWRTDMSVLLEALARSRQVQQAQQADVVADASGSVDSAAAGLTLSDGGNLALAPEALPPQSEFQPYLVGIMPMLTLAALLFLWDLSQ